MIEFVGHQWMICEASDSYKPDYGRCNYVYMITHVLDGERKILYIGTSCDLNRRVRGHYILRLFRYNSVYHKIQFMYMVVEEKPYKLEASLIREYDPPFNLMDCKRKMGKILSKAWRELGVKRPTY